MSKIATINTNNISTGITLHSSFLCFKFFYTETELTVANSPFSFVASFDPFITDGSLSLLDKPITTVAVENCYGEEDDCGKNKK
jgi:hypothetical protein